MTLIESMVPQVEVCSNDEMFCDLTGHPDDLTALGGSIRQKMMRCTGIPVGVGIARTKTLAKLANHTAKRSQQHTGGMVDIGNPFKRDWVLPNTAVVQVWGVGRRLNDHLQAVGIQSAMDLVEADPVILRAKFSVVLERTARELAGVFCLELEDLEPPNH